MEGLEVDLKVHYGWMSGAHSDATITKVYNDIVVDLHIMDGDQEYDRKTVTYRKEPVPYSWHFVKDDGEAGSDSAPTSS